MPEFTFVDQPESIRANIDSFDRIAVDTEFMRERTFFAELCLVQIATADEIYCVDPLVNHDLDGFWDSLLQPTWVLHSGRQDIEVIYQTAGKMPAALFDTQIAAGLLGFAPQMGYATLVKELFDTDLPKSHTRADWSKRPLSAAFLEYAAEDVEYLLPAYELLAERLDQKGRLAWAEEDAAQLLNPDLYDVDPLLAIDRMKGARNLRGSRRAAAAHLAAWRETEALRANRPRQWIAKDSALLEIAAKQPASVSELVEIDGLPAGLIRRSGKNLLQALATAGSDNTDYAPPGPPDESQKALLRSMQQYVAACADDLGIAAETLGSKRELSAIIFAGDKGSRLLSGWRRPLVGDELLKLL